MKLEDQVVSLELAKKLKELGFKQDSLFDWQRSWHDKPYKLNPGGTWETLDKDGRISAYTVAELGEMFKPGYGSFKNKEISKFSYKKSGTEVREQFEFVCFAPYTLGTPFKQPTMSDDKEADARAKMLIYLKENNLI